MLNKIRIVLLHTSHPGNIGASARAMKVMGLSRLFLVQPKAYPSEVGRALSANADDVYDGAIVCESLAEAIADCEVVYGSGSELRAFEQPVFSPREAACAVMERHSGREIAFVFGNESMGMTSEEMRLCQYQIQIPGNPAYCSLNLGAAVQVMTYELQQALRSAVSSVALINKVPRLASNEELEGLYQHYLSVMRETKFYDPAYPMSLETKLRRIFNEASLRKNEVNMLRGFLSSVQHQLRQK